MQVTILTARADDLFVAREEFQREVTGTTLFLGMSAVVHPHHLELFHAIAQKGADITHILSPEAATTLNRVYPEMTRKLLSLKSNCLYVSSEEFFWECVITDRAVFFSLFTTEKMTDPLRDLYTTEPGARIWAADLIARYRKSSHRLHLA